jgi:hypothetical protein
MRKVTNHGAPWSDGWTDVKWRASMQLDFSGRPMYRSVNRHFDDHRKTSSHWDSIPYHPSAPEPRFIPLKRVVGGKASVLSHLRNLSGRYPCVQYTLSKQYLGNLDFADKKIVFQGSSDLGVFGNPLYLTHRKFWEILFTDVAFVFLRRYLHSHIGCEIFTVFRKSVLLTFASKAKRNNFINRIRKATGGQVVGGLFDGFQKLQSLI